MPTNNQLAELLAEIQSDAVYESVGLTILLRKCKVLAGYLGDQELAFWAHNEAVGYELHIQVPSYRQWRVRLTGMFAGLFGKTSVHNIPVDLSPDIECLSLYKCRHGITNIEKLLAKNQDQIDLDTKGFHRRVGRKFLRGSTCVRVEATYESFRLTDILHAVRERIIEITLRLDEQHPDLRHVKTTSIPHGRSEAHRSFSMNMPINTDLSTEEVTNIAAWARRRNQR